MWRLIQWGFDPQVSYWHWPVQRRGILPEDALLAHMFHQPSEGLLLPLYYLLVPAIGSWRTSVATPGRTSKFCTERDSDCLLTDCRGTLRLLWTQAAGCTLKLEQVAVLQLGREPMASCATVCAWDRGSRLYSSRRHRTPKYCATRAERRFP
ncbi:hypothetical protein GY45DRAFT_704286 [Cubamyces sp. BRFM 1775]|nr:hypothetical protein GY45DRAFT_704286 [Cubamyces sp. BRFM 1775]